MFEMIYSFRTLAIICRICIQLLLMVFACAFLFYNFLFLFYHYLKKNAVVLKLYLLTVPRGIFQNEKKEKAIRGWRRKYIFTCIHICIHTY